MKEGRKAKYPEKTPGDELQNLPDTKARRFKAQARLEPAQQHWWQVRKADVLTVISDGGFMRADLLLLILCTLAPEGCFFQQKRVVY